MDELSAHAFRRPALKNKDCRVPTPGVVLEVPEVSRDGAIRRGEAAPRRFLEALAGPGGICVSAIVHDHVQGRLDCAFDDLGEQILKNITRPIRVYRIPLSRTAGEGAERMRGG